MSNISKRINDCLIRMINFNAFKRLDAIDDIRSRTFTLSEHTLKLLLYPESRDYNHWMNEILANLFYIKKHTKLKGNIKFNNKQLLKLLWDESFSDGISDYYFRIKCIEDEYGMAHPQNYYDMDVINSSLRSLYNAYISFIMDEFDKNQLLIILNKKCIKLRKF